MCGGDAVRGGEGEGGGELRAGQGGGVGDDGEHAVAEGLVRGIGEEGGVGAAGVGDEQRAEVREGLVEERGFGGEVHDDDCSLMRGRAHEAGWGRVVEMGWSLGLGRDGKDLVPDRVIDGNSEAEVLLA